MENLLKLLAYLDRNGGSDRTTFWLSDGGPDMASARRYAEGMRNQLGRYLNDWVAVEQRVNSVIVTFIGEPVSV